MSDTAYGDWLVLTVHRTRKLAQLIQDAVDEGITYGDIFEIQESTAIAHHRLEEIAKQLEIEMPMTVREALGSAGRGTDAETKHAEF